MFDSINGCFKFRFRIALRQISGNDEDINEALNNFKINGFINYYGHQRFGNHASVPTHQIGLFLVQGNFKEVNEKIFNCLLWIQVDLLISNIEMFFRLGMRVHFEAT